MIYAELIGGLGNQMFVYAFARALGLRYNEPVTIIDGKSESRSLFNNRLGQLCISPEVHFLEGPDQAKRHCFWPSRAKALMIKYEQRQGMNARDWNGFERRMAPLLNFFGLHYATDGYTPCTRHRRPKDFLAYGYFQGEEYFEPFADTIRAELRPREALPPECAEWAKRIDACPAPVALHARRGDFFARPENAFLRVCTPAYYRRAVARVRELVPNAELFIFSDDPAWAAENIDPGGLPAHVIPAGHRTVEDLALMMHCKHFILSNSTYSWWGQYLSGSEQRVVIAPDRWYANGKQSALYQPFWHLVDCSETADGT